MTRIICVGTVVLMIGTGLRVEAQRPRAEVTNPRLKEQAAMLARAAAAVELPAYAKGSERQVKEIVSLLRAGKTTEAQSRWSQFIEKMAAGGGAIDPNALVQHVLRESYLQTTEDLRFYADKVKYFNEQKAAVRKYLAALREYDSRMKDSKGAFEGRVPVLRDSYAPGASAIKGTVARAIPDRAALRDEIKKWEEKLNGMGDDAQLANVDLQNILQKQQQTLQMMSNISKMLHDTAQAVIRNIRG